MQSGMIRRIDELGRIVIPKEIRKNLKMNTGDSLELHLDEDNKIVLKKHSSLLGLEVDMFNIAKVINEISNASILIVDGNKIIVSYGKRSELYLDSSVNMSLYHKETGINKKYNELLITEDFLDTRSGYIYSLKKKKEVIGLFIVLENEPTSLNKHEIIQSFVSFINKQLEY